MKLVIDATERVFGQLTLQQGVPWAEIDDAQRRLGLELPEALRVMYLRMGRHPLHSTENRLVPPAHLRIMSDHLIIYREQHDTCEWGVRAKELARPDPPVDSTATGASGVEFVPEFSSLSQFVAFQIGWQAVGGALPFVGVVVPQQLPGGSNRPSARPTLSDARRELVGELLANTKFAQVRFRDGAIAVSQADGYFGLATRDANTFRRVADELGMGLDTWSYATLRDDADNAS